MRDWWETAESWTPPPGWAHVGVVDAHTAGEPLRVILSGFEGLKGDSVLALRRDARARMDWLRRALMWEPRGHADMYGCIVVPPVTAGAHFGVLFTHNEGYSTMCGHGIIAVATVVSELGLLPLEGSEPRLRIDTPAGVVEAVVRRPGGRTEDVSFVNVPSFVGALDRKVGVPGLGDVTYDLAFGGAFYAFVDAEQLGLALVPESYRELIAAGSAIKRAVRALGDPTHPDDPELGFLYGTIFVGPPEDGTHHSRNVCVFADGEVDRSPTGTGVSARLALHHARGEVGEGDSITIESILGTTFRGRVLGSTTVAGIPAVIPEVTGSAHLTGRADMFLDPGDPLLEGFFLR